MLSEADVLILVPVYAAREKDIYGVSSLDIVRLVEKRDENTGREVHYFDTFAETEKFLKKISSTGDLLITMGAGDVVKIGEELLADA